jgi:phosphatidylserine/phosphatidylglycerophosphate/cardiolipin synthase-like enzyme
METIDKSQPHIPFLTSNSYPVRAGNFVRPLIDGEPAFRRICEAIEAARHSVWVTVAFITPDFNMPDGRGSLFDVLDRAVARGLDVRAIFWRSNPEASWVAQTFSGSQAQRDMLRARGSRFRARWDRAYEAVCHHQKSWLVDAGHASETAFVGGINLNPRFVVTPGHLSDGHHDAYLEITGPSATDVHHNFVQRWNEASERGSDEGVWGHDGDDDLDFPTRPSAQTGESLVQIQRTVHTGRYRDSRPSPGAKPFNIADGERSILVQYQQAIGAARHSIYIENQALEASEIVTCLDGALMRGVEVVVLVPAEPEGRVRAARGRPERRSFYDQLAALDRHERFALVGIAGPSPDGGRRNIYVHDKVMLIDDAWATIGSCNLHAGSLFGQTEMNASFWNPTVVRALRCELLAEHLDQDTAHLDDRAALGLYRRIAKQNRLKRDVGDHKWQGIAFSLDPSTYGE